MHELAHKNGPSPCFISSSTESPESHPDTLDTFSPDEILKLMSIDIRFQGRRQWWPTTTSLIVPEAFGKEHKNVMRDINVIIKTLDSNGIDALNFEPISYIDSMNREKPMYSMDRKAYSQLVMSFTGEKATLLRKIVLALLVYCAAHYNQRMA